MARCCGGATCSCKIEAGRHVQITGIGSAQDPFVIAGLTHLTVQESDQFQLLLNGSGTLDAPWTLSVHYAPAAGLGGLPDVSAEAPGSNHVLGYDPVEGKWTPRAPTTAAPGAITTGNGVSGDGSGGSPLAAIGNAARFITVTSSGIGLSDSGVNRLVRVFSTITARNNANPAPVQGTLALVEADKSVLWYYDGANWVNAIQGVTKDIAGQLLATSGNYSGGPTTQYVRQLSLNTDGSGIFTAVPAANLVGYSGVLSCTVTPRGAGTAWVPMVTTGGGAVTCRAVRVSDGGALAGASITATVEALLY